MSEITQNLLEDFQICQKMSKTSPKMTKSNQKMSKSSPKMSKNIKKVLELTSKSYSEKKCGIYLQHPYAGL